MVSLITLGFVGALFAADSDFHIREKIRDPSSKMVMINGERIIEREPRKLEYQLCSPDPVEDLVAEYTRSDGILDYINLKKVGDVSFNQDTCFVVDPLLSHLNGSFVVRGHLEAPSPYDEKEDLSPVTLYARNGWLKLEDSFSEEELTGRNHLYSVTPPTEGCILDMGDHLLLSFEDMYASDLKAFAFRKGTSEVRELKQVGYSTQEASFYLPPYLTNSNFFFLAEDPDGNRSFLKGLKDFQRCD